jgi:hypothetical protein
VLQGFSHRAPAVGLVTLQRKKSQEPGGPAAPATTAPAAQPAQPAPKSPTAEQEDLKKLGQEICSLAIRFAYGSILLN